MSAAIAYKPDKSEACLVFDMQPRPYNTDSLIEFLEKFHRHFKGEKVTLIWDGLPSHRSKAMKNWIGKQRRWLVVERLPAYAPELNPVELLWGKRQGQRAGQPLSRDHRRGAGCRRGGSATCRYRLPAVLQLPGSHWSLSVTKSSLY